MKKTFAASVVVATIAGSLTAMPASAQRGVAAGVAAPGRYYEPAPYGAGRGPYDYFGCCILAVANGCNSVSMTAMAGVSAECESAADPRLRRD